MGKFSIIVPEATTNLATNPSFEINTTGWTDYSSGSATGSRTRTASESYFGAYSYQFIKTGDVAATDRWGAYDSFAGAAATDYMVTAWIKISAISGGNTQARLHIEGNWGAEGASQNAYTTITGVTGWARVSRSFTTVDAAFINVFVFFIDCDTGTLYVDGLQIEAKDHATTYCDGEQPGCEWTGAPHNSTSEREAQSRAGGRVRDITDDYNLVVQDATGFGMPPLSQQVQAHAMQPGAVHTGYKVQPRAITLTGSTDSTTAGGMHDAIKDLVDLVKPDRVKGVQPFILRYTGTGTDVDIECYLDDGPHGALNQAMTQENFVVRFMSYDPFWYEVGEEAQQLDTLGTLAFNYNLARIDGVWTSMGGGFDYAVDAGLKAKDGSLYVTGGFTSGQFLVKYAADTWTFCGGLLSDVTKALAEAPNGDIYIGGKFHTAGTTAALHIARYDGTKWNAVGSGTTDWVETLAFDYVGYLWAGGAFHTAGGVADTYSIARYQPDTATWMAGHPTGYAPNGPVYCLVPHKPKLYTPEIYIGGQFSSMGSLARHRVARLAYREIVGATYALGDGLRGLTPHSLVMTPANRLYAGGEFATAGGASAKNIAVWDGSQWSSLGAGLTTLNVYDMALADNDDLWVVGRFRTAGSLSSAAGLAIWNGMEWNRPGIMLTTGTPLAYSVFVDGQDVYIGTGNSGTARANSLTTSATNNGTATAYPRIEIKRTGGTGAQLRQIKNVDTGDTLFFHYDILEDETITIDLTPEQPQITSDYQGNMNWILRPGSNLSTFRLLPGTNRISCLIMETGGPTVTAHMVWRKTHWAAHGSYA